MLATQDLCCCTVDIATCRPGFSSDCIINIRKLLETQQVNNNEHGTAVIYTDSKITLDSIRSAKNHIHLLEEIRKRTVTLNKKNGKVEFKWVKAHTGIYGNEITDQLAKEATQNY